jgi:thiol:disulfide interchange protein
MNSRISTALVLALACAAGAEPVRDGAVEAELVAENQWVQPGKPFWVGLRLAMDQHWHTYWINPGDSGLGTTIDWKLPAGYEAGPIVWPYPRRIEMEPLVSFGYSGEILLLTEIRPTGTPAAATQLVLKATADWLMCKEACIPGTAKLDLSMPVRSDAAPPDGRWTNLFAVARAEFPIAESGWHFSATIEGKKFLLFARPAGADAAAVKSAYFFAEQESLLPASATQAWRKDGDLYVLESPVADTLEEIPSTIAGVLYAKDGWMKGRPAKALQVRADVSRGSAAGAGAQPTAQAPSGGRAMSVPLALAFAFLGGMILNLMPCVFPVLSLKIFGFVQEAGESHAKVWQHALVFAGGVLVSFWILASVLLILRAGGEQIGWGFQLQNPIFVVLLAALFFLLGLNMFGVFEVGLSLTGTGGQLLGKRGWAGSFFSGFLATVAATPCTAPFMGAALGFALAQPYWVSLAIFTCLGLGMAAPYVVLAGSPALLKRMPRPGAWMESVKQFMGFPLMATAVWLCWVLGRQAGSDAVILLLLGFVLMGLGGWILGRWGAPERPQRSRIVGRSLGTVLIAAGLWGGLAGAKPLAAGAPSEVVRTGSIAWEPFTPERVKELRSEGKPVFLDFTAAWCLSCQVNEKVAFSSPEVQKRFAEQGLVALRADWTDRNETIGRALAAYGRNGVPLYVLYGPGSNSPPVLLPELLTPAIVLNALDRIR